MLPRVIGRQQHDLTQFTTPAFAGITWGSEIGCHPLMQTCHIFFCHACLHGHFAQVRDAHQYILIGRERLPYPRCHGHDGAADRRGDSGLFLNGLILLHRRF